MTHLILWAVLIAESLAINSAVQSLLAESSLLGYGDCSIYLLSMLRQLCSREHWF